MREGSAALAGRQHRDRRQLTDVIGGRSRRRWKRARPGGRRRTRSKPPARYRPRLPDGCRPAGWWRRSLRQGFPARNPAPSTAHPPPPDRAVAQTGFPRPQPCTIDRHPPPQTGGRPGRVSPPATLHHRPLTRHAQTGRSPRQGFPAHNPAPSTAHPPPPDRRSLRQGPGRPNTAPSTATRPHRAFGDGVSPPDAQSDVPNGIVSSPLPPGSACHRRRSRRLVRLSAGHHRASTLGRRAPDEPRRPRGWRP